MVVEKGTQFSKMWFIFDQAHLRIEYFMSFSSLGGRESTTFTENMVGKLPPNPAKMVEFVALSDAPLKIWSKSCHQIKKCGRNSTTSQRPVVDKLPLDPRRVVEFVALSSSLLKMWSKPFHLAG